ncbi:LOW QUALITY PROTEIN: dynein assembly factor 4, axonemal [Sitophilus oryzae]|uniref:LOW QUALITY PROTEIN: dynein assembly factor 4, axonemal n=1 Tax=Sitophilus oryzae TaxID=7048 RepID=A0A6J2XGD9_SITOR|nr:LOW QUALITY PROTEIN: dynein assembly factor 4, axonemal [Sitophilus oryzae]
MPIIIKDFKWKQTEENIVIQVPLHGVHQSKIDIFTSPQYLKASFEHFFFEVLLLYPVDILNSSCIKTGTEIIFELKKYPQGIWDSLEITHISKQEKLEMKKKIIETEHAKIQKECEEKQNKKAQLKRVAINQQIELDTKTRNRIDEIRKTEQANALGNLNEWREQAEISTKTTYKKKEIKSEDKICLREKDNFNGNRISGTLIKKNVKPELKNTVPKLRSTRSLQILFTNREFPTPCRESRLEEENEFLKKQAEARRSCGFVDKDLRPEEKNPQYLLAKGQEFLKNNNYLGAISAFSFAIKLSPDFLDLYIARSEAHLRSGNFKRAAEDCSDALKLLRPALPINLDDRALCIGRRGVALFKLGFLKQGISELKASLKLKKDEEFENILNDFEMEFQKILIEEEKKKEKEKNMSSTKVDCAG